MKDFKDDSSSKYLGINLTKNMYNFCGRQLCLDIKGHLNKYTIGQLSILGRRGILTFFFYVVF